MLLANKQIAIIGGGPGGLTLARLLQLKGVAIKVYERDVNRSVRVQGATLDLHFDSGLKAIEKAGLMEAFKANYRPGADKGRIIDSQGKIVYDEHTETSAIGFDSEWFRPEIDRGPLREILLDALQKDTVVWDSQFLAMQRVDSQWKLEFKNGTTAFADVVIGADGANSKIRPFVTPIEVSYAGITIVQGNIADSKITVPNIDQLLKGGKIYVHSDRKFIHISAKGDGSIDFYISCKVDENWAKNSGIDFSDRLQVCKWFKEAFLGWDNIWLELFENTSLPLLLRPQYYVPFDQQWEAQPNITLLGDAAHLMPPSGEGVNLAMLDALEISECLTGDEFKTTLAAIAAYEARMFKRASTATKEALEMVEWMHADDAQDKMLQLLNQTQ